MTTPSESLVVAVLPTRRLTFEFEHCDCPVARDRADLERRVHEMCAADLGRALLALGVIDRAVRFSPSVEFWRELSGSFVHQLLVDPRTEELRGKAHVELPPEEARRWAARAPAMVGAELIDAPLIEETWRFLQESFRNVIRDRKEPVEQTLRGLAPGHWLFADRVHFHLVENRVDEEAPFAFLATYSKTVDNRGTLRHLPLGNALSEFGKNTKKLLGLLSAVHKAAARSRLVKSLLDSGEIFQPLRFTSKEAYEFLKEVPLYEEAGILCRVPRWWGAAPRRISTAVAIGESAGGKLGADTLLSLTPMLHVDGEPISPDEAKRILQQYDGLALIKGKWTVVDRESLQKNLALFKQGRALSRKVKVTFAEAMRMLTGIQRPALNAKEQWDGDVVCGTRLRETLDKLTSPHLLRKVKPPRGLVGTLRPYQQYGLNWLAFLYQLGMGACLADDMGLGKTIQVLALLQRCKESKNGASSPSLLVVPASLIDNWLDEARKFTPHLRCTVAHPQFATSADLKRLARKPGGRDLVITTYAMTRRLGWLKKITWNLVILDEAQAVKNPGAAQTRAVKELSARHRIVMTGTPIENRLGDLWSLFDFSNRGLLGSARSFREYAKKLNDHPEGYARLRRVIQPYVLRRLKTDKSIIADLPEKVEMKTWASLSRKQVVIYRGLVSELSGAVSSQSGMKRRGMILGYLMKFKQLCNHPDQLSGEGGFKERDSGKLTRLRDLCESIHEKRERVVVFTQFREMVGPLDDFLFEIFGRGGATLHGGTNVGKRKAAVARFQNQSEYVPYFVLSLKAGGVGLNLTAANHVVHFDRWWNPAVEKQAEDRTFRIGQKRNVVVHKFVCRGTVEEKIDSMIEEKKELAERVLSAGAEKLITEMSDRELHDMFALTLNDQE